MRLLPVPLRIRLAEVAEPVSVSEPFRPRMVVLPLKALASMLSLLVVPTSMADWMPEMVSCACAPAWCRVTDAARPPAVPVTVRSASGSPA